MLTIDVDNVLEILFWIVILLCWAVVFIFWCWFQNLAQDL